MDTYGHRGGIVQLVPEHSIGSFSLGAQTGANYLEPDVMVSKDGELIVSHDLELSKTTDIASHPEFANRFTSITVWRRGNPENYTNGQPESIINKYENQTGYFVFNFTLNELKTLKKISSTYPENSPFNGIWEILTFNESLEITNNLSQILGRPIGIIPETKHPEYYKHILGVNDFEYKMLESLKDYGFVYIDNDGYYKPYYFIDENSENMNKSSVILQSFTSESLFRFDVFSNSFIPRMFLMGNYDIDDINGVEKSVIEWILSFADYIGCSKSKVKHLVDVRDRYDDLIFDIGTYTLLDDINEYIKFIDYGLSGVFSDNVGTGTVVKDLLNELVNDINNNSTLSSFCNANNNINEDVAKIEMKWAFIGATIALICGALIGVFGFYWWTTCKLNKFTRRRLSDQ